MWTIAILSINGLRKRDLLPHTTVQLSTDWLSSPNSPFQAGLRNDGWNFLSTSPSQCA